MVEYSGYVMKALKKGDLPTRIFRTFNNAFQSLDITKDLDLFDIKRLEGDYKKVYYRLRKGKYRGIFWKDDENIYVEIIEKRDEVYNIWQQKQ